MIQIFAILFQTYVFAAAIPVNEAELLKATGLEKSYISKETEDSLESLLLISENGFTCGLEEFYIDGYNITDGTESAPKKFEVITVVIGPANSCASSEEFKCYTHFYLQNDTWKSLGAECEYDSKFNE
jgi:hypothetical protein